MNNNNLQESINILRGYQYSSPFTNDSVQPTLDDIRIADSFANKQHNKCLDNLQQAIDRLEDLEKENEELKRINKQLNETCDDFDREHTRILLEWQKVDKALDYTCNFNVCFKEECDILPTHKNCKDCRKRFALEKARKELENGK